MCTSVYKKTNEVLETGGLRENSKFIIGGRAASGKVAGDADADAYCKNAWTIVRKVKLLKKE